MSALRCLPWIVALALAIPNGACDVDVPVFARDTAPGTDSLGALDEASGLASDSANEAGFDTGPFADP